MRRIALPILIILIAVVLGRGRELCVLNLDVLRLLVLQSAVQRFQILLRLRFHIATVKHVAIFAVESDVVLDHT